MRGLKSEESRRPIVDPDHENKTLQQGASTTVFAAAPARRDRRRTPAGAATTNSRDGWDVQGAESHGRRVLVRRPWLRAVHDRNTFSRPCHTVVTRLAACCTARCLLTDCRALSSPAAELTQDVDRLA